MNALSAKSPASHRSSLALFLVAVCLLPAYPARGQSTPAIPRTVPPPGIELPAETRTKLEQQLASAARELESLEDNPLHADAEVFLKSVALALRHGEFYAPADAAKADQVLNMGLARISQLRAGAHPWSQSHGLVVRGFTSRIDGSAQPYGLVIPETLDLSRPAPLYVWLHGRGDKQTDLHFIAQRLAQAGEVRPENAIVLHPFGRQCIGFKSAGETDVLEAIEHVQSQYNIDPNRIVLMGFSMGGAGCWHLGAHYADRFVAMSPGAGFAETAEYNRLTPDKYPPVYEQILWGLYDVPAYTRNLFNLPVVAYSGELDKQIQAARVMERAFERHGRTLPHVVGPGMGHKYHPDSLREILERMRQAVEKGRDPRPKQVWLQTRTLRYNRMFWVEAVELDEHWRDSRIDAEVHDDGVNLTTKNIASLRLHDWVRPGLSVVVDGQRLVAPSRPTTGQTWQLSKRDERWGWGKSTAGTKRLAKRHGFQGPIDDAFLDEFLVVTPEGDAADPIHRWVTGEWKHLEDRWAALFRGRLRTKPASRVTEEDIQQYHLVLFGSPRSNPWVDRVMPHLPIEWGESVIRVGSQEFDATTHVPVLIYPNPLAPDRYVVLNSGPTFREAHDRTNSLQNPKLPDWAVLDISQPPNAESAGRVAAAEFFDEAWQLRDSHNGD